MVLIFMATTLGPSSEAAAAERERVSERRGREEPEKSDNLVVWRSVDGNLITLFMRTLNHN